MEEVGLLRDDAHDGREGGEGQIPDVDAVDRDGSLRCVVEAGHKVGARGLPGTRLANQGCFCSGWSGEGEVVKGPVAGVVVAKPDAREGHVTSHRTDLARTLDDVDRLVEVFEDPVKECKRGLHLDLNPEQSADGKEELCQERRERDDRADADRLVPT